MLVSSRETWRIVTDVWQVEEVKGVIQVMDQEEEIAIQEFNRFEEKLRQQKGADSPPPSTVGKDGLDSAPG
jgi:NFU1 iron-sulfur cluster scaffold homolog, mitochondrial